MLEEIFSILIRLIINGSEDNIKKDKLFKNLEVNVNKNNNLSTEIKNRISNKNKNPNENFNKII